MEALATVALTLLVLSGSVILGVKVAKKVLGPSALRLGAGDRVQVTNGSDSIPGVVCFDESATNLVVDIHDTRLGVSE